MPDYQPIDYRLRCHTKRTDLPSDVLRDIGEAYAEIERLRKERDDVRREVCGFHHLTGFLAGDYANSRGWDCFPNRDYEFEPSVKDFKLFLESQDKIFLDRIDRLTAECDEARRLVETIAHDVSVLSTRPAAIIKFTDLVDLINEWGDAARNILDKKDNSNG